MNNDIVKNVLFIVIGAVLLSIVELKLFQFNEIITLIIGFIGFIGVVDGIFGLYNVFTKNGDVKKSSKNDEDPKL